jgi:hypothetical protein
LLLVSAGVLVLCTSGIAPFGVAAVCIRPLPGPLIQQLHLFYMHMYTHKMNINPVSLCVVGSGDAMKPDVSQGLLYLRRVWR